MIVKTIHDLESKARVAFEERGYAKATIRRNLKVMQLIVQMHREQGAEQLTPSIISDFLSTEETRWRNNEITKGYFQLQRKATEHLAEIYDTGYISCKRRNLLPALPEFFEFILSDILGNESRNQKYRKRMYDYARPFFRWFSAKGNNDLSSMNEQIIREYLTIYSNQMARCTVKSVQFALKELFMFLYEKRFVSQTYGKMFTFSIPAGKKIKPFMPQDEIAAILNIMDRSTTLGKRDYAITLLAAVTGLRACDIVALTLTSIDWRNGEIKISQEKTGKALALPLTSDVGEAIRDYILNGRPKSDSDKIFLLSRAPFTPLSRGAICNNVINHRKKAGLTTHGSFHGLRRSIATNMVTSGTSVITVAQVLGHSTINSTNQYIALDSKHLKKCALDFRDISNGGDTQ
jgi:site-specific recombinase XerD